jgi:glutamyl-tRNA synthetase
MAPAEKRRIVEPFWLELGLAPNMLGEKYLEDALALMGGRGRTTRELAEYSDYFVDFFPVKERYDASDVQPERRPLLRKFFAELMDLPAWNPGGMEAFAREWCDANSSPLKDVALPLRWALTGRKVSPGIFEVAALLGRDECRERLTYYKFL